MAKQFTYIKDGIEFSKVVRPVSIVRAVPHGLKDAYTVDEETGTITNEEITTVFNAIDIDWNGAILPNKGETINTTSDLLNVIDKVEEVDVSGLAETFATKEELTQNEETIAETITALNNTIENKVDWVESVSGRNHIVLKNHDSVLGTATDNNTYNLAMVSKWDVADFGSAQLHANLNTSDKVTINDDKVIATTDQLDSMASGLSTTINSIAQAVSGKASTEYVDTKIADLIASAPAELDTLKEIADELANDKNALSGLFNVISTKASIDDVNTVKADSYNYKLELQDNINSLDSNISSLANNVYSKEEADGKFITEIPEVDLSEYATLTYVDDKVEQIVGTAPENFDTLEELAAVMGDLKVVDTPAQEATYYEDGDELPEGAQIGDEKTPAVEEVSHNMTISEFVTTSMEAVNEKPEISVLTKRLSNLEKFVNRYVTLTPAQQQTVANDSTVTETLANATSVTIEEGTIADIVVPETTKTTTITGELDPNSTLELTSPKSVTINNTGTESTNLTVNAPAEGATPTVTLKSGTYDTVTVQDASLTVSNDATVQNVVITSETTKSTTINATFAEGATITSNSEAPITVTNKNVEGEEVSVTLNAPGSTVTLSGGKWTTISGEVSENTLIIKGSAKIQSLNLTKGNVIVEVPREEDIHNVITGEITLGEGYTITHRQYDITNENSSKLGGVGEMIVQEDLTRTSSIVAPLAPAYNAVWNLNGHNITVEGTPKSGVYLNRYSSNLEVKGSGTIHAEGTYGLWNSATTGKIIVNDGVTVEAQTHVLYAEKGTIEVNGGTFKLTNADTADKDVNDNFKFLLNCYDANYTNGTANIIVKGGKFYGFNPAESYGEPSGPVNFVAKGYESVPTNEAYEYGTVYEVHKNNVEIDFDNDGLVSQIDYQILKNIIASTNLDDVNYDSEGKTYNGKSLDLNNDGSVSATDISSFINIRNSLDDKYKDDYTPNGSLEEDKSTDIINNYYAEHGTYPSLDKFKELLAE